MTKIIVPSFTLPRLVELEGNPHDLYYYQVETKGDLINIIRYLTTVVTLNPSAQCRVNAVFKANNELYYLRVDVDDNHNGEYLLEWTLYQCTCSKTSELNSWYDWYSIADEERYGFDDIWEPEDLNRFIQKLPKSLGDRYIPESIAAGYDEYLSMWQQTNMFSTLFHQLKD